MIDLAGIRSAYARRPLLVGREALDYATFCDRAAACGREDGGSLVSLRLDHSPHSWAALLGAWEAGRDVCLNPDLGLTAEALRPFRSGGPLLVLPSGATSGSPRHIVHDAATFLRRYAVLPRPERRQLFLYAAGHLAGLDAFLQAVHRGATLVRAEAGWEGLREAMAGEAVQVIAATPSQLHFMLLADVFTEAAVRALEVVVHGAEPMPGALMERLRARLPAVRFEQRFGMSEVGALPTRADPADASALFLDPPHRWKVESGQLHIAGPGRMLGTLESGPLAPAEWFSTGDAAEVTASGAVRVLGRLESRINVGGVKVLPEEVEAVLLQLEFIQDARVYGEADGFTGQRVVAEVVMANEAGAASLRAEVRRHCRSAGLPLEAVPSRLRRVASILRTATGKRAREPM